MLTETSVAEQLRKCRGNISEVARHYKVYRQRVCEFIEQRPALQKVRDEARELVIDGVESVLVREAMKGAPWAVCFFLKTQAKHRGYAEKESDKPITEAKESIGPRQVIRVKTQRQAAFLQENRDADLELVDDDAAAPPAAHGANGNGKTAPRRGNGKPEAETVPCA